MNFNTDGFNERMNYINNSNDMNRINRMGPSNSDSSFAQMKINENKPNVETIDTDKVIVCEEAKGNKENFVLRNYNMNNVNRRVNPNNPVNNAMRNNNFKRF